MAKRILVVDDDPVQRRVLEEMIKRMGFEVTTVSDGDSAITTLQDARPGSFSLVLLDMVMPGVDGIAVLERLIPQANMPPFIVQTANGSVDAAVNAMRAGAVDFVVKPTSPERLEVSINTALKIEALTGEITRIKKKSDGKLTFEELNN